MPLPMKAASISAIIGKSSGETMELLGKKKRP